jgi:RNA polymerase sigma factor (sigma-70 family)
MSGDQRQRADAPLSDLVAGALAGDQAAWDALVVRLERVVWKAVNMMTYDPDVRADAFGATWLRLAERLDQIREPEKLPGWLTTTACNEVRQILRHRGRQHHSLDTLESAGSHAAGGVLDALVADADHAGELIADERRREVRAAFNRLDEQCRELLTVLLLADPPVPYEEASARLGRPVGALGPSRRRCLEKMRTLLEAGGGR